MMLVIRIFFFLLSVLSYKILFCSTRPISLAALVLCMVCAACVAIVLNDATHVIMYKEFNATQMVFEHTCSSVKNTKNILQTEAKDLWENLVGVLW